MSVRINKVYTRSGDDGGTGLVGGSRARKSDARVSAYGNLDEINSWFGLIKEKLPAEWKETHTIIERLQQELFDLGSELATLPSTAYEGMWHVEARHVQALEKLCDKYGEGLPELRSFILPGGSEIAALFHIVRTVIRRSERELVALYDSGKSGTENDRVSEEAIQYLNRLSDLMFIFARWALKMQGKSTPLWKKEADRGY